MADNLPKTRLLHELLADEVETLDAAKLDKVTGIPGEIVASDEQTVIADTDIFPVVETTTLKKTLWSTIKSTLKTYFDGLYLALTGGTLTGGLTITAATDAVNSTKITDKDGNVILSVDTTNNRVGVLTNAPTKKFQVVGEISSLDTLTGVITAEFFSTYAGGNPSYPRAFFYGYRTGGSIVNFGLYAASGDATGTTQTPAFLGVSTNKDVKQASSKQILIYQSTTEAIISTYTAENTIGTDLYLGGIVGSGIMVVKNTGKVGIKTTAPDKQLEINSADGNCLRLTYNDANGSATYYSDFTVSSAGLLSVAPSGGYTIHTGMIRTTKIWHAYGGCQSVSEAQTMSGWSKITNGSGTLLTLTEADGFTIDDDVITVVNAGDYIGHVSLTFIGSTAKDYHIRIYNVTQGIQMGYIVGASGLGVGNYQHLSLPLYLECAANDQLQIEVEETGDTALTVTDCVFYISYLHD